MEPTVSVAADLLALSEALDEPGADVESMLRTLRAGFALAITSCLGFSITLVVDGAAFSVTVFERPLGSLAMVASVTIPLVSDPRFEAGSEITFYATEPGGLVHLAAELSFALGLSPDVAHVDLRRAPGASGTTTTGLPYARSRNLALGILLDQGYDLDRARAELNRLADQGRATPEVVATRLINATIRPPTREPP